MENIKRKVLIMLFLLVISLSAIGTIKAKEDKELFTKIFTSKDIESSLSYYSSNGNSVFLGNSVVTAAKDRNNKYVLYNYNLNGQLTKKVTFPNVKLIYQMEEHENFLYIFTYEDNNRYVLYKFDDSLKKISSKLLPIPCYKYYSDNTFNSVPLNFTQIVPYEGTHNAKIMAFEEDNIALCIGTEIPYPCTNLYLIDYDFKEINNIGYSSEYVTKYFSDYISDIIYLHNGASLAGDIYPTETRAIYNEEGSLEHLLFVGYDKEDKPAMTEVKGLKITGEEYKKFYAPILTKDYIAVIAGKTKDANTEAYVGDILIYDLDGNHFQTISFDRTITYFDISEDSIVVGTQAYDGICEIDKYNINDANDFNWDTSNCDVLTNISVYKLTSNLPEEPENFPTSEPKNPETSIFSVNRISLTCILILIIGTIFIGYNSYKKIKYFK